MSYKNPASSSNYINKDFQKIFPEMLDLVKKLTYKWDPSISNESDPGVILLKLNAIISDKSNYNIDKGVLEFFPETVTQERNAYSLFKQVGYYPKWIISSNTEVSFKYTGSQKYEGASVTIPMFTQICDESNSVVYATTDKDVTLKIDGSGDIATSNALQGKVNYYKINGDDRIRFSDLDSNRRLYFDELNVAQNGIFITNYGQNRYEDWQLTDNIYSEQIVSASNGTGTTKYYSFGLSQDLGRCYIEFAEDIEEHIEDGISIVYLTSDGSEGNVPVFEITRLKEDVTVKYAIDSEITLNAENLLIKNINSGVSGKDAETIDDMYNNYKRVVGTFNTLVSLRDYINYILRTGLVSNGFVCDRSNDIQSSCKIVTIDNGIDVVKSVVLEKSGKDELSAFDLRMYLNSNNTDPLDTLEAYQSTFKFLSSNSEIEKDLIDRMKNKDQCKTILHDFADIISYNGTDSIVRFCGFRNKFNINCKVIPQYDITEVQRDQIITNIRKAVFEKFNASKLNYGEEASYDDMYNTIMSSDERIKTIYLGDFEYKVYGVYWTGYSFQEIDISNSDNAKNNIIARSILAGKTQGIKKDNKYTYSLNTLVNNEYKDVSSVESIANISWSEFGGNASNVSYSITNENENLVFYAPNLVDDITYSTYTRYKYRGSNISADDGAVELKGDTDSLIFYWQENSSSVYKSKAYGKGTIIRTNFDLVPTDPTYMDVNDPTVISNSIGNLNSNKTISILGKNQVTLNARTKCYWILNSKTAEGKYSLFANGNKYILKSGEYFIYTNNEENSLEILGSGTMLNREVGDGGSSSSWEVDVIDPESVIENGLSADIKWFKVPAYTSVVVTEMELYIAGKGKTVRMDNVSSSVTNWTGNTEYNLSGATIRIADTPSGGNVSNISWSDTDSVDSLRKIDTSGDDWCGTSILNINMSPIKGQELGTNHKIVFNDNSSSYVDGSSSKYIMASTYLDMPGSSYIDVRTYNMTNGDYSPISFLSYNESSLPSITNGSIKRGENGVLDVSINNSNVATTTYIDFTTKLIANEKYAFSIFNTNDDINTSNISVKVDGVNSSVLANSTSFAYFGFTANGSNQSINISVMREAVSELDQAETITIQPPFGYTEGNYNSNVSNIANTLDKNHIFDVGYDVNDDVEIDKPEVAKTFFDPNHIYNKFTLPYIENISISVTNVE